MMVARLPRPLSRLARGARGVARLGALAALVAVVACSSPTSRFYTLGDAGAGSLAPVTARTSVPAWMIAVAPIDVPPQVAKNQLVVRTGPTQVQVLEEERWASLTGDEIRRALSTDLTQQLGTIDVYGTAYPDSTLVYRVSMNVQRFESWPGSHALIDAVWSVCAVRSTAIMTCRSVVNEPVNGGYDALVAGHKKALQEISSQVATTVKAMASAAPRTTSGAGGKNAAVANVPPCPSGLTTDSNSAATGT
ncbi:MAG: ortholog of Bordetella pertussis (BX470248) BP2750 [uncultured Paraburkholderia sp.]|nr:MAG: ortholog of Bordetella pertussis (BX470248) BP2750 [uncultured Paraburkholderia sp.]CAH2919061.1 MAG: ortholog of Bordetella pertussis (BX470248) BP2750 [uncultured Paraburkholderia sp.]